MICQECIEKINITSEGQGKSIMLCSNCSFEDVSIYLENQRKAMTEQNDVKPLLMQHLHGIDHLKQIFDLWFELNYLRCVLNEITVENKLTLNPKSLEKARDMAKMMMKERFPTVDLDYSNPKENK